MPDDPKTTKAPEPTKAPDSTKAPEPTKAPQCNCPNNDANTVLGSISMVMFAVVLSLW